MSRIHLLLLCGGQSEEHEVSLSSARSVLAAVGDRIEVTPLVVDKGGKLLPPEPSLAALSKGRAEAGEGGSDLASLAGSALQGDRFDVVFPLLHGPNGEDGTVQGLLELLGLPFVGSSVLGSAVGMDKLMMKGIFAAAGLPQVPYLGLNRFAWNEDRRKAMASIELRYPLFVKPANLGSSVGISRAQTPEELERAIELAFGFDRRVIVEQGVPGARELEVAVLGNDTPSLSPVGEITFDSEFYDYGTKYTQGRSQLSIPAAVPDSVVDRIHEFAHRAFTAIDAAGLARVDFFYREETDELLVNEINTMPGFTATSMYPKLWEAAGVPYGELVERLVQLALEPR